jgi:hypothetical protein
LVDLQFLLALEVGGVGRDCLRLPGLGSLICAIVRRLKFSDEVIQRASWARIPPARFCIFGFKMLIHGSPLFGVLLAYFPPPLIMNTLAFAGVVLDVTGYVLSNLSLYLFGGATT